MEKLFIRVLSLVSIIFSSYIYCDDKLVIKGEILDEISKEKILGLNVSLSTYKKSWMFWRMPDIEHIDNVISDENGQFILKSNELKYYVITLRESVCWKPYSETFTKLDIEKIDLLKIYTARSTQDYCLKK